MDSKPNNKKDILQEVTNLIHQNKLRIARAALESDPNFQTDADLLLLRIDAIRDEQVHFVQQLLTRTLKIKESAWLLYKAFEFYNARKNMKQTRFFKNKLQSSLKQSARDFCAHGYFYLSLDQSNKAELEFKEALDKDSDCLLALMGLARVSVFKKNKQGQIKWLTKAIQVCPFYHDALLELAKIQVQMENYYEALETIDTLKNQCKPSPMVTFYEGKCYQSQKRFLKARGIFLSLLGCVGSGANLELEIGKSYLAEGLYKKVGNADSAGLIGRPTTG